MEAGGRESYAPAAQRLDGYTSGASPEQLAGLADELLAIGELLGHQAGLRRALTDPARLPADRVGLLRDLLSGKVGDEALGLVGELVQARWSSPGQLRDAVERLGVDALLAGAEKAGELSEVEDELFRFGQVVDGSDPLAGVLGDPTAPVAQRGQLIDALLDGKARPTTIRLAKLALTGFGGRSFSASLARLVELTAARRDRTVAYVTSAIPLTEADETRLGTELARRYGRQVSVRVTVDPEILGGLSVQIGSDLYDGTVLRRLIQARTALTK
jgi:F-type H+-transporting ATPase subunit delta